VTHSENEPGGYWNARHIHLVRERSRVSGTMTTPSTRSEEFGPWPLSIVGRQWRKVMRQHGWRRIAAVAAIGAEVLLIIVIVALLVI
jgi:hypothetical protein